MQDNKKILWVLLSLVLITNIFWIAIFYFGEFVNTSYLDLLEKKKDQIEVKKESRHFNFFDISDLIYSHGDFNLSHIDFLMLGESEVEGSFRLISKFKPYKFVPILMFRVEGDGVEKIPRRSSSYGAIDGLPVFFTFENYQDALEMLQIDEKVFEDSSICSVEGSAKIKIKDFILAESSAEFGAIDSTSLEEVISLNGPRLVKCAI